MVEWLRKLADVVLHLDTYLGGIIEQYSTGTYVILFAIVFLETGFVVTPFLPGDSLLFAAGTFAGAGNLNVWILFFSLTTAAIIGDTVNYWIGHYIGPRAFTGEYRFLKKEHLDRTHRFFEKYGGKTIILARFVPIVRTFAPFVAGIGAMSYPRFLTYNVVGGVVWVGGFVLFGYFFGGLSFVKDNFSLVVLVIIILSVLPGVYEVARHYWSREQRE